MKNRDTIIAMVDRAIKEVEAHRQATREHCYWYSGHKGKAKRAIMTARELLQEASKALDE